MNEQYNLEIHRLLKLGDNLILPDTHSIPESLPILDMSGSPSSDVTPLKNNFTQTLNIIGQGAGRLKGLLIYPVIFIGALAFFYVVLNFSSLLAQAQGWFIKPQAQVVLGDQTAAYYQWIKGYYYAVSDPKLLEPNNDISHNGLTNMDKFIMHTNPIVADSNGDGILDGVKILNSMNPWGSGPMTAQQKQWRSQLNLSLINDRISYYVSGNNQKGLVSGANTTNYDLNKPGVLSIPRLNLQVPLTWSKDPSDFEADLTHGVIHYPGTALPGEQGMVYVSGHSSDYIWKHDAMASIFSRINYLQPGDDIFIEVYDLGGKVYNYRYQVTGQKVYAPDDQTQFIDNSANRLNLSTCWPIGTAANRLVVTALEKSL